MTDSVRLLAIEHMTRIVAQSKTRFELGGTFWSYYQRSVRIPNQWDDGDGWLVNYVGHPMHGAAAGTVALDGVARVSHILVTARETKGAAVLRCR